MYKLNKKVLLVDFSETEALTESIPISDVFNENTSYLDYRGIDFIKGCDYYFKVEGEREYDYIIHDFGFNQEILSDISCDIIIYITDLQLHHVKKIDIKREDNNPKRYIVIKDVLPCKIRPKLILEQISKEVVVEDVYIIDQDDLDIKFKIYSQYNQAFYFNKLSKSMKTFLKDIISKFDENLDKTQIEKAYKKAERGG